MHPHAGSMSATVPLRSLLVLLLATFSVASLLDECLEITDCLACIQHEGCGYCVQFAMNTGNLISAMSILPTLQSFEGIQRRCLPGFVYGSNVHEYQTDNPIECPVDYWTHKDNPAQNECMYNRETSWYHNETGPWMYWFTMETSAASLDHASLQGSTHRFRNPLFSSSDWSQFLGLAALANEHVILVGRLKILWTGSLGQMGTPPFITIEGATSLFVSASIVALPVLIEFDDVDGGGYYCHSWWNCPDFFNTRQTYFLGNASITSTEVPGKYINMTVNKDGLILHCQMLDIEAATEPNSNPFVVPCTLGINDFQWTSMHPNASLALMAFGYSLTVNASAKVTLSVPPCLLMIDSVCQWNFSWDVSWFVDWKFVVDSSFLSLPPDTVEGSPIIQATGVNGYNGIANNPFPPPFWETQNVTSYTIRRDPTDITVTATVDTTVTVDPGYASLLAGGDGGGGGEDGSSSLTYVWIGVAIAIILIVGVLGVLAYVFRDRLKRLWKARESEEYVLN